MYTLSKCRLVLFFLGGGGNVEITWLYKKYEIVGCCILLNLSNIAVMSNVEIKFPKNDLCHIKIPIISK